METNSYYSSLISRVNNDRGALRKRKNSIETKRQTQTEEKRKERRGQQQHEAAAAHVRRSSCLELEARARGSSILNLIAGTWRSVPVIRNTTRYNAILYPVTVSRASYAYCDGSQAVIECMRRN